MDKGGRMPPQSSLMNMQLMPAASNVDFASAASSSLEKERIVTRSGHVPPEGETFATAPLDYALARIVSKQERKFAV